MRVLERGRLLGPAFVAAVAYVDPGNVATNTAAGAQFGYLLLWVLVAATVMAGLVQYLSAKIGWLTGESLPALIAQRNRRGARLAFWAQAELVALATDLAEIVGGAVALQLLFGLPVVAGGVITTVVSTALLAVQNRRGQRPFERVIAGLLAIVVIGFLAGLVIAPPDPRAAAAGLVPRLAGTDSALVRDRHGRADADTALDTLRGIRWDVIAAMLVAGSVNVGMLLLAASTLFGLPVHNLQQAQVALGSALGPVVATLFALALLASGLASTSVGGYAGAVIMDGLLNRRIPLLARRLITAVPALILLAVGLDPTRLLIISQVVLSFGIPFALVPLVRIAGDSSLMELAPSRRSTVVLAWLVVAIVVTFNVALIVLLLLGR